jgi:prolyl-tRNA editing enzyme YbaK/EbsC (Cys-tRNA(Pro) deacylase)
VLALTSGRNRVDTAKLAALCGAVDARKATADEVRAATGTRSAAAPHRSATRRGSAASGPRPDCFRYRLGRSGTPDSVFPIDPDELMRLAGARVAPFTETRPGG